MLLGPTVMLLGPFCPPSAAVGWVLSMAEGDHPPKYTLRPSVVPHRQTHGRCTRCAIRMRGRLKKTGVGGVGGLGGVPFRLGAAAPSVVKRTTSTGYHLMRVHTHSAGACHHPIFLLLTKELVFRPPFLPPPTDSPLPPPPPSQPTMASSAPGIKQLLEAEKFSADLIKQARNRESLEPPARP